jgi:hypothetical protein
MKTQLLRNGLGGPVEHVNESGKGALDYGRPEEQMRHL